MHAYGDYHGGTLGLMSTLGANLQSCELRLYCPQCDNLHNIGYLQLGPDFVIMR